MQKISLFTLLVILFTSCSDILFTSPQPSFAKNSSDISEDFQGKFNVDKGLYPSDTLNITDNTITFNGIDYTISDDNFVVKSWGNYLFLNLKDSTQKWQLLTILSAPHSLNNTVLEMNSSTIDVGRFNNVDTIAADTTNPNSYTKYILNEVNTLQFHYLLRMSSKSQFDLIRLEEVIAVEEEIEDEESLESDIEENLTTEE